MDSHGGWISTPADYARYAQGTAHQPFGGSSWWFNGSLAGTQTTVQYSQNGDLVMALYFNTRLAPSANKTGLNQTLGDALGQVDKWPCHDLNSEIP